MMFNCHLPRSIFCIVCVSVHHIFCILICSHAGTAEETTSGCHDCPHVLRWPSPTRGLQCPSTTNRTKMTALCVSVQNTSLVFPPHVLHALHINCGCMSAVSSSVFIQAHFSCHRIYRLCLAFPSTCAVTACIYSKYCRWWSVRSSEWLPSFSHCPRWKKNARSFGRLNINTRARENLVRLPGVEIRLLCCIP